MLYRVHLAQAGFKLTTDSLKELKLLSGNQMWGEQTDTGKT